MIVCHNGYISINVYSLLRHMYLQHTYYGSCYCSVHYYIAIRYSTRDSRQMFIDLS